MAFSQSMQNVHWEFKNQNHLHLSYILLLHQLSVENKQNDDPQTFTAMEEDFEREEREKAEREAAEKERAEREALIEKMKADAEEA